MQKSAAKTASLPIQKLAAKTVSLPISEIDSENCVINSIYIYIYIYFFSFGCLHIHLVYVRILDEGITVAMS